MPTTYPFLYLSEANFFMLAALSKHKRIHGPNLLFVSRVKKLHLVGRDLMTPPKLPRNAPITAKQTEVHCWQPVTLTQESILHRSGVILRTCHTSKNETQRHCSPSRCPDHMTVKIHDFCPGQRSGQSTWCRRASSSMFWCRGEGWFPAVHHPQPDRERNSHISEINTCWYINSWSTTGYLKTCGATMIL